MQMEKMRENNLLVVHRVFSLPPLFFSHVSKQPVRALMPSRQVCEAACLV
jgi:hypothetical protein